MTFGLKLGRGYPSRHREPLMIAQLQTAQWSRVTELRKTSASTPSIISALGHFNVKLLTDIILFPTFILQSIKIEPNVGKCWGQPALISFPLSPPWVCVLECQIGFEKRVQDVCIGGTTFFPLVETKDSSYFILLCEYTTFLNSLTITLNCDFQ